MSTLMQTQADFHLALCFFFHFVLFPLFCKRKTGSLVFIAFFCCSSSRLSLICCEHLLQASFDTRKLKEATCYLLFVWLLHSTPSSTPDSFPRSLFSCVLPTVSTPQHSQQKLYGTYCFANPIPKLYGWCAWLGTNLLDVDFSQSVLWSYQRELQLSIYSVYSMG